MSNENRTDEEIRERIRQISDEFKRGRKWSPHRDMICYECGCIIEHDGKMKRYCDPCREVRKERWKASLQKSASERNEKRKEDEEKRREAYEAQVKARKEEEAKRSVEDFSGGYVR
jgi:hypothetical protein